jgi:4-amino-4-deoxy-L-arabinose transferase-like glycosyltransferase
MNTARLDRVALAGTVVALATLQLCLRPATPVDETRYLSVAWEMWTRGDFLLPWLNGEPYSHKPPLLFWLIHGLWSLFGVSEVAARLLPVGLSLAALWWSQRLSRRLWDDPAVARLVPWLILGSVFWNNFQSLLQFDILLALTALVAWEGVMVSLRAPLRGGTQLATATALGLLAKGPVILVAILPAVLLAPWWAIAQRPSNWASWYAGCLGALVAAAAMALAWALPAGLAGGEAYREALLWGQTAGRMVDAFAHPSPWWSYLWWLPLMCLPWTVWPQLWRALRRVRCGDQGTRFCIAVLLPALLVFTLISAKQPKYLLPLLPLMAALAARALVSANQGRYRTRFVALLLAASGILLAALPVLDVGPAWLSQVQPLWGLLLLVAAALSWFPALQLGAVVRAAAIAVSVWTAVVSSALLGPARPVLDVRPVSRVLAQLQAEGHRLAYLGKYHGQFHFTGRLLQRIAPLASREAVDAWLSEHPNGYLIVNYKSAAPRLDARVPVYPYRGGVLVVWPAGELLSDPARLDGLAGNA